MTERESFHISEMKEKLFEECQYRCRVCGKPVTQLAHRIPQKYAKYLGKDVIHHPFNLVPVCDLTCNSAVNINNNPLGIKALVDKINEDLLERILDNV